MVRRFNKFNKKSDYTWEDVKNGLVIAAVVLVIGGGVFAWTWIMMDSGYGPECLFVRCVKVID